MVKIDAFDNEMCVKGQKLEARGVPLLAKRDVRTRTIRVDEETQDVGLHWFIGKDEKKRVILQPWLLNNSNEPACKVSYTMTILNLTSYSHIT